MYTESTGNVNGNTTRIGESECEAIGSFFASILPDEGRRCIAALSPDEPGMRHYWFEDNESAAAKALDLDRAGYNVFFGCAAYKDASSRAQSNVQSVKAFWLDVDAGEGKPYADLKTAAEAFTAARGKLALPGPVAVRSGNGLHLYFRMPEAIPPATWQRIARKLKLAIAHAGLEADPARTCDHASVLRVPYTHNRKSVPRPVGVVGKSLSDAKVVPYAELEATLDQYIADNGLAAIEQKPADNLNADLMGGMQDSWFDRLSAADKDPCLAEILQQPAIAALALTKDSDPDPNWRTVIAACRRSGAANSEELCRAWAQRGNYTEDHFNSSWRYYGKPVKDGQPAIGIGTLIQLARQGGWDPAVWKRKTGGTLAVTGAGGGCTNLAGCAAVRTERAIWKPAGGHRCGVDKQALWLRARLGPGRIVFSH